MQNAYSENHSYMALLLSFHKGDNFIDAVMKNLLTIENN